MSIIRGKKSMINSVDIEKDFRKNSASFPLRTLMKLRMEEISLNIIKIISVALYSLGES
jgi:hypothetical protein